MTANNLTGEPAYFRSLILENVRCFGKRQSIDFLKPDGNISFWNIIIGENGVGKTTVLRSLAFSYLNFTVELYPDGYFNRIAESAPVINYVFENLEGNYIRGGRHFDKGFKYTGTGFVQLILGYGASRRIAYSTLTEEKTKSPVNNLFDENATLMNAEEWLIESDYRASKSENGHYAERKEKVIQILKKLFRGEVHDFKIDLEGKRPKAKFLTDYGWVNLHDLSLGYKTLIAWMTDFASRMFEEYPDSPDPLAEPAVVLVDEIDLHLHPQFQRELVSFLTETFPKTQFIVTAHSPLILQSAPDANIILLKKEGDHVIVEQNPHEIKNWRIDQLLTSDLYGLPSTRPPQTEKKIERRRSLLKKDKLTKKEETELEQLEKELVELPVGETPEAIKAMEIIQKAAKHYEKQQNGKD